MKMNYMFIGAFLVFAAHSTIGQHLKNEVQILEASYRIEKKNIIEQAMGLSVVDALAFWPIYEKYEEKRGRLGEGRLYIIHDYVIAYPSITNAQAAQIASRCFKNDESLARLHKKYYRKIKRTLSPLQAAQFVQIEGYLEHVVRIQIQTGLPFIGEIDAISPMNVLDR